MFKITKFVSGNSKPSHPHGHGHSAIKDLAGSILGCSDDKKDDGELWGNVEAQTAFLGPNLWDKTYETDLKVCIPACNSCLITILLLKVKKNNWLRIADKTMY